MKRSPSGAAAANGLLLIIAIDRNKFPAPLCVCQTGWFPNSANPFPSSATPPLCPNTTHMLLQLFAASCATVRLALTPHTSSRLPFGSNLIKPLRSCQGCTSSGVVFTKERKREKKRAHESKFFIFINVFFFLRWQLQLVAAHRCLSAFCLGFWILVWERRSLVSPPWNAENVNIKGLI